MSESVYKNPGAVMMANTRWSKATPQEKAAQAAKMIAGRKRAKKRPRKESA